MTESKHSDEAPRETTEQPVVQDPTKRYPMVSGGSPTP